MSKIHFIRQHDSMQCGTACLLMVCHYYGKKYSFTYMSEYLFSSSEGVSLQGINEAAENLGMRTMCGRTSIGQLVNAPLPCILHWNQNHFVVLYKVKHVGHGLNRTLRFYIADPAKGLLKYTEEDMSLYWTSTSSGKEEKGIALFLQPTQKFFRFYKKADNEKRSFAFLLGYIKQYRKYFSQIILGMLLSSVLQLLFPFLTQTIVDFGITNKNINFIYLILLAQLALTISRTSIDFIRRWLLLHISIRINISLLSDFFIKLLNLPMSFFDTKQTGDILQRMEDHTRIENFLTSQCLGMIFSLVSLVIFGGVLLGYNTAIFTVFLIGSIFYGSWIIAFLNKRKILDQINFEQHAKSNNQTYRFICNMQEIKLQDCECRRRWEWEDTQADLAGTNMRMLKMQQCQEAGGVLINEVKNIVITVVSAISVINGDMTLGMMLAVQYIVGQLHLPITQLLHFVYSLQDVKMSLERINEIHTMKEEEHIGGHHALKRFHSDRCLAFDHVFFKYNIHSKKFTLSDINIKIPEGKVTAIVGASGSGKTTMLKLLLGFYPISKGCIKIGKLSLSDYNMRWWRRQCGVVMQDGVIFSESIARNIAIDDNEIDEVRLKTASHIACIDGFIDSLPLKYNTQIGPDGIGISQGQKQRILIARAVYRNPDFILLDEATNSLDANNEKIIVERLNSFYKGRTVLIVAHRLSTVKSADNIIVLEKGIVKESGNHANLVSQKGLYYNLVKNQLELGNE
ncbi:MAG: peptidase domain-containing ABC transporter [Roseburia sp.]|nr:peptidase domain-containing ABC transporter [Roseburia sp.]MCM1440108.1 peptidase domain-containing ABC transporter [Roseburia sp.]